MRKRRIDAYSKLWCRLQPLAKYAREGVFARDQAEGLSQKLRAWYFEEGGLLFSEESRDAFFDLQDAITKAVERNEQTDTELPEFSDIRQIASTLRTTLARDVGTRKKGSFRDATYN